MQWRIGATTHDFLGRLAVTVTRLGVNLDHQRVRLQVLHVMLLVDHALFDTVESVCNIV